MDITNLRSKTIFDLCDDRNKIAEFIPSAIDPAFDLVAYRHFCMTNPTNNALHMTLLANVICSNELNQAVQQEFAAELTAFFQHES